MGLFLKYLFTFRKVIQEGYFFCGFYSESIILMKTIVKKEVTFHLLKPAGFVNINGQLSYFHENIWLKGYSRI